MDKCRTNGSAMSQTLIELLRWRACVQPDCLAYTFLIDGEEKATHLTYAELDRRAQIIAVRLQSMGGSGHAVLLLYPPGLEYITAFFGCLYAGAIAVPAYPPRNNQLNTRLETIVHDTQAKIALTIRQVLSTVERQFASAPELECLQWNTTELLNDLEGQWVEPEVDGGTIAFLQYTSGSTTEPKGVMLSHTNLLQNLAFIQQRFKHTQDTRAVIWLPPYHDMGLIGGILQPLYAGFPVTLMSPVAFLQHPIKWLEAVTHYGANTSGGPDFAYDLCSRKVTPEQLTGLDLSSWTVAFCGAEPIHPEMLERFTMLFEPCGFRREAFYPCYGLAEATLMVSGMQKGVPPVIEAFEQEAIEQDRVVVASETSTRIQRLVGCGQAQTDHTLVIVHPETFEQCASDQIGEIWVSGSHVALGYWNNPNETQRTFRAYVATRGEGPFLRTGDLGFLLHGEVFITGRLKDLIIIRGRNYYPQDIERTVEQCHNVFRPGCGAAFSIDGDSGEQLVIIQEVQRHYMQYTSREEIYNSIRLAVAQHHALQVYAIVLMKAGSIPKTSSGKIRRQACRTLFLAKSLQGLDESILNATFSSPGEAIVATGNGFSPSYTTLSLMELMAYVQQLIADVLRIDAKKLHTLQLLNTAALDSLMAIEIKNRIESDLTIEISFVELLQGITIDQLVKQIYEQLNTRNLISSSRTALIAPPVVQSSQEQAPLSFEQERLWFLNRKQPDNAVYNIPIAVRLEGTLVPVLLIRSLNELGKRHEALRTSFVMVHGRAVQMIAQEQMIELPLIDLSRLGESERGECVKRLSTEATQQPFLLRQSPLVRGMLIRQTLQDHIIVFIAHHIIADVFSMIIMVRDILAYYRGFSTKCPPSLPVPPFHYRDFVVWQRQRLQGSMLETHLSYWKEKLLPVPAMLNLPVDQPLSEPQTTKGAHYFFQIPLELTDALRTLSRQEGVTLFMMLMSAVKILLHHITKQDHILVTLPVAGRTRHGTEHLIGFFAHPLPIYTDLSGDPTFRTLLMRLRSTLLEAYEHQEVPFAKIVEAVYARQNTKRSPFSQVMFSLVKSPLSDLQLPTLTVSSVNVESKMTDFDLFLTLVEDVEDMQAILSYNATLFHTTTIEWIMRTFLLLLQQLTQEPEKKLSQFLLPTHAQFSPHKPQTICICANFTAEPIQDALTFWMQKLSLSYVLKFAPYNQVLPQLLDPGSLLSKNQQGINVVCISIEGWLRYNDAQEVPIGIEVVNYRMIELLVQDFVQALKATRAYSTALYLICFCPPSPSTPQHSDQAAFYGRMEHYVVEELKEIGAINVVTTEELSMLYPLAAYYDALSDKLGHIPYTPRFFASLATMITRRIYALQYNTYKVIVLDCDRVLWKGVLAEDGLQGIEVSGPYRELQDFMVAQYENGMLLCLCSKNNQDDVLAVFEHCVDMPLKRSHILSWYVNWRPKSENIQSLAHELQLGLESFIFLDDDPVEVAEVQAHCPEVLALQLPEQPEKCIPFLRHVWAFDHAQSTREDANRTILYKQNRARQQFQQTTLTLEDFLSSLCIQVEIAAVSLPHVCRVAQLTQRTNQFNLTGIRRSESEVLQLYHAGIAQCLTVEVSDRFGAYGMVGVLIFTLEPTVMNIDTMLLSCRALGRRVEHRMLAHLGEIAQKHGVSYLDIPCIPTQRNQPACDFLLAIGKSYMQVRENGWLFRFPAEVAASAVSR